MAFHYGPNTSAFGNTAVGPPNTQIGLELEEIQTEVSIRVEWFRNSLF